MSRPATGQVVVRDGKRGRSFALRFRAYGRREYVTLGTAEEGWTDTRAETELANVLADVRRGIWRPAEPTPIVEPRPEPTFHEFASEWLEGKRTEGLRRSTIDDYKWCLSNHLLPFFASFRLRDITVRDVDRYKLAKAREGALGANQINKTLTRLSQVLGLAVEYELIPANPAAGKRRRLKGTKPRRGWVEPEQLLTLLEAAETPTKLLAGRGRPLLATLAGAGLRIDEALSLQRRNVNLAKGTLLVEDAKTDAGNRLIDLTPALRDELALWLDPSPFTKPSDLVFPTLKGGKDNRHNVGVRLVKKAIERANKRLAELGLDPIEGVTAHGLRRTYASLRCAVGDDVAYTAEQLGHTDPTFSLKTYVHAVKRRERLSEVERREFDRAVEWAQWARMGTDGAQGDVVEAATEPVPATEEAV